MNFGNIIRNACANVPLPPDSRCADPEFALLNPGICPSAPTLIIKPSSALVCRLGSIQLKAFILAGGMEKDVTDDTVFSSSDTSVLVIGATSGNATGLSTGVSGGQAIITATNGTLTGTAQIDVLTQSQNCCSAEKVALMVMVDISQSMSQSFNSQYSTRLEFAKTVAKQFILQNNSQKDVIGVMTFDALGSSVLAAPNASVNPMLAAVNGITSRAQKTTFFDAFTLAISTLNATPCDKRIIILISDGEDQQASYLTNNPIAALADFKNAGGIVMCLGTRASATDQGFARLEAFSTGGFFVNAYGTIANDALVTFDGLKGYVCAGNCTPDGDVYEPTPTLNYTNFTNWDVLTGQVNLLGPGLFDMLPGNGLYIGLDSYPCSLQTKSAFSLQAGNTYRIRLSVAGNQKIDNGTATLTITIGAEFTQTIVIPKFEQGLTDYSFNFTVAAAVSDKIVLSGTIGSPAIAEWGVLIDNVKLDNVTDGTQIFSEEFTSENIQYVPPRCGLGTTYVPVADGTDSISYTSPVFNSNTFGGPIADAVPINIGTLSNGGTYQLVCTAYNPNANGSSNGLCQFSALLQYTDINDQLVMANAGVTIVNIGSGEGPVVVTYPDQITDAKPGTSLTLQIGVNDISNSQPAPFFLAPGVVDCDPSLDRPIHLKIEVISMTAGGGYGYVHGYNCYGEGCLSEPPAAQLPDPSPLPDIESGYTPPRIYTSTKTECASCAAGFANFPSASLVPVMTSNTAPSGVASSMPVNDNAYFAFNAFTDAAHLWSNDPLDVGTSFPIWLQYQFSVATEVSFYSFAVWKTARVPTAWELQGSNDGSTWTTVDSRTGTGWFYRQTRRYKLSSPATFTFFRLNILSVAFTGVGGGAVITDFSLLAPVPAQICAVASDTSTTSQADADSKASAAALATAQSKLNCIQQFSSSETATVKCPVGSFGIPVTDTESATSFVSQQEADSEALAVATAAAEALLDCTLSNNTNTITIADHAVASPYPSVQFVSGKTGVITGITGVTVNISKLTHLNPDDIIMVLRGPDGTTCYLMANCGGINAITNVDLVFSDAAGSSLPDSTIITSGTFKPTNFTPIALLPAPGPQPAIGTTLSVFNGKNPNGPWSLWVYDDSPLGAGSITNGFLVNITSV